MGIVDSMVRWLQDHIPPPVLTATLLVAAALLVYIALSGTPHGKASSIVKLAL